MIAASSPSQGSHASRVSVSAAMKAAKAMPTGMAMRPCSRRRLIAAWTMMRTRPAGSGSARIQAGTCRIGVSSLAFAVMKSNEASAASPATNSTTISDRARQARSPLAGNRPTTSRTNACSRRRYATAPPMKARIDSDMRATSSDHRKEWWKTARATTFASTIASSASSATTINASAVRSIACIRRRPSGGASDKAPAARSRCAIIRRAPYGCECFSSFLPGARPLAVVAVSSRRQVTPSK